MSNKLKSIFLSIICLVLFVLPLFVHAMEPGSKEVGASCAKDADCESCKCEGGVCVGTFFDACSPTRMIRSIYWFGVGIVGFAAVVVLVIAGIMYIQSYGDPQKITMAKQFISGALIGVVLLLFSYTILRTVNPALVRLREPLLEVKITLPVSMIYGKECETDEDCVRGECKAISGLEKKQCVCKAKGDSCTENRECCGGGCSPSTGKCFCIEAGSSCPTDPADCCSGECKEGKCTVSPPYKYEDVCTANIYGCDVNANLYCRRVEPRTYHARCENGTCSPLGDQCWVEKDTCCGTGVTNHCEVTQFYSASESYKINEVITVGSKGKCKSGKCTPKGEMCSTSYSNCCEGLVCKDISGWPPYPTCIEE